MKQAGRLAGWLAGWLASTHADGEAEGRVGSRHSPAWSCACGTCSETATSRSASTWTTEQEDGTIRRWFEHMLLLTCVEEGLINPFLRASLPELPPVNCVRDEQHFRRGGHCTTGQHLRMCWGGSHGYVWFTDIVLLYCTFHEHSRTCMWLGQTGDYGAPCIVLLAAMSNGAPLHVVHLYLAERTWRSVQLSHFRVSIHPANHKAYITASAAENMPITHFHVHITVLKSSCCDTPND